MSFGAVVGALSVLLAGQLGMLGSLAAPVAVGIGAAVLVLAAHVGLLGTIPASFYGFASIAGLILLKGVAPAKAILPTILSIVAGTAFGFVSAKLGAAMTKASRPAACAGLSVTDKESASPNDTDSFISVLISRKDPKGEQNLQNEIGRHDREQRWHAQGLGAWHRDGRARRCFRCRRSTALAVP